MENGCRLISVTELCEILREKDNYTLLAHAQPDGDTIGSCYSLAYALKLIGKKVRVLCSDAIPHKYNYITGALNQDEIDEETVIALDVADSKLLGKYNGIYGKRVDICIDHHVSNVKYARKLLLGASASATCEIVYEIVKELGVEWDRRIVDGIYTGIVTDTGCFKYSNTPARTHIITAELISLGADYAEINRLMFDTKSKSRVKIEGTVMENIEFYLGGRLAMVAVTRNMIEECGAGEDELDGINALPRTIEGVMVGVTIREKAEGRYKISVRTNAPLDAMAICRHFGGGGHQGAAGCEFECPLSEVKAQLLPVIKEALEEQGCLI